MKTGFVCAALNAGFSHWDFGVGPFTADGYTATRWKRASSGSPSISIERGVNDNLASTPKWLQNQPYMIIDVNAFNPATDTIQLRQRLEQGGRFGEQCVILSGMAAGPAGGAFYAAIHNQSFKVETKGQEAGVDILTHFNIAFTVGLQDMEFMPIDVFTRPSSTGRYKLFFAMPEYSEYLAEPSQFELRNPGLERVLLNRYAYPLPRGITGVANAAGTGIVFGVPFHTTMRVNPNFRLLKTTGVDLVPLIAGPKVTSSGTISSASTEPSQNGARLALSNGWTGLTPGALYMLATDGVGLYDADY